ncbi:MAG: hypothetical protein ACFFBQ_06820 [Promethearchaeota archaeon]
MKENRTIRKLIDTDFDAFLDIWAEAYPGQVPPNFTEDMKREKKKRMDMR